ncbi:helix-turn-helix domain-containing protein [Salmonella enterica]|nr:helix-turn-helix domain-containing protein [Salmonella enterica]
MSSVNKFREHRLAHAWSQEQLAEMTGLSVRTIQRIENGERPGLETLSALAAVFEVNVAELTGAAISGDEALDERIAYVRKQLDEEIHFYRSGITAIVCCTLLSVINYATSPDSKWSAWMAVIWGTLLVIRGVKTFVMGGIIGRWQRKRFQKLLRR